MAREWTRAKIETALRQSTGLEVRIDSVIFRPLPPQLELRGVGFARAGRRVAQIPAARAWVRPLPLLRSDLHLTRLEIDSPLLEVDTDLAFPAGSGGGNGTVRIDAFHLRDGRLLLRDAAGTWEIAVPRFRMESAHLWQGGVLTGFLDGDRIRFQIGENRFEPLTVRGRIGFAGGRWTVAPGRLEWGGRGRVDVDGRLDLPAARDARPAYAADLDVEIAPGPLSERLPWRIPAVGGEPLGWSGRVEGTGSDFRLRGRLRSGSLVAFGLAFSELAGDLSGSPGGLELEELSARLFEGALQTGVRLRPGPAGWLVEGKAGLHEARFGALPLPSPLLSLIAPLDPRFSLTLDGSLPAPDPSRSDLTWTLSLMPPDRDPLRASTGPHGAFRGAFRNGNLLLQEGTLNVVGVELRLNGTASWDGPIRFPVTASVIDAAPTMEAIAGIWPAAAAAERWRPRGEIRLSGEVEGTRAAPRLQADLQGIALGAAGIDLGSLAARVSVDREGLVVDDGILDGAVARAAFRAQGSFAGQARLQVYGILDRVDLSALSRIGGSPDAAAGRLAGEARLDWDRSGPVLRADLAGEDLSAAGLALDRAAIVGSYGPSGLVLDRFHLERGAGSLEAEGSMPVSGEGGRITIRAAGFPIDSVAGIEDLSGRLTGDALIGGSIPAPLPLEPVMFRVEDLAWRGAGPIAAAGSIHVQEETLVVEIQAGDGTMRGWARIPLDPGAPFRAEAEIDRLEWEIDPKEGRPGGTLEAAGARFTAGGSLSRLEEAEYELEVGTVGWRSEEWTIANLAPVLLWGTGRSLRLPSASFGIGNQEFTISGEAELGDPPTYSAAAEGSVDLRLLEPFLPETRLGGAALAGIRLTGRGSDLALSGGLELTGGFFKRSDFPLVLEAVSARVSLSGDRLILSDLLGRAGYGVVSGVGEAVLRGSRLADYRIDLRGEGVDLEYPPDLNSLSDFRLTLAPRDGAPLLSGRIDLQRARYTRNFHLETALLSSSPPAVARAAPSALLDRVGLDIRLSADDQVWIDNDLARAELWAEMELVGTAARPLVLGTLESLEAGQVRFQRVKYDLTAATVQFTVSPPNDPDLNFRAETRVGSHRVFLTVSGRLSRPQIDLTSDPELPREQIVALLLTGGTWGGGKDAELSPQFAINYLAGSLEPVQKAIGRLTGVDVRIDPSSLEGQEDPMARVTVGKEFSGRLRAAYSTSLSRAEGDIAEIRFRILPRLELRQAREDTGRDIFEARFVRSFRTGPGPDPKVERPGPSGPTVASVTLDPVPDPPGEDGVREALALTQGGTAEPGELRIAAKRAQRALIRAGRPLARVRCEAEPGDAAVPVHCVVVPGPEMLLSVRGVAGSRLRQVREAVFEEWETARFEGDLVPAAIATAERHFRAQGRARARARAEVEPGAAGIPTLALQVDPGPEVRVSRVELVGVRQLPERLLEGNLLSTHRVAGRKPLLVPSRIEEDRERVRRL
ncbi:MAG: translocation/assembly module TamB domain-containing protein, partial [Acidobacteria bacterium]|nr:translocation/assembly module TamB domain-containing protein [Acidobacteriota bacterium]